jgi:hypothetical protein
MVSSPKKGKKKAKARAKPETPEAAKRTKAKRVGKSVRPAADAAARSQSAAARRERDRKAKEARAKAEQAARLLVLRVPPSSPTVVILHRRVKTMPRTEATPTLSNTKASDVTSTPRARVKEQKPRRREDNTATGIRPNSRAKTVGAVFIQEPQTVG